MVPRAESYTQKMFARNEALANASRYLGRSHIPFVVIDGFPKTLEIPLVFGSRCANDVVEESLVGNVEIGVISVQTDRIHDELGEADHVHHALRLRQGH